MKSFAETAAEIKLQELKEKTYYEILSYLIINNLI